MITWIKMLILARIDYKEAIKEFNITEIIVSTSTETIEREVTE